MDTGISNGRMMMRLMMSQTVTTEMPTRHTHGRFERRSSPRNMDTMFGTIRPRNGRLPTTTVTMPVAMAMSPVPMKTMRR